MRPNSPFVIGLTGSIGMGKSTTAKMFADEDIPVWDADAAVHRLYARGGAAVTPMATLYPDAVTDNCVNRDILKNRITEDPAALKKIEEIVHPLVAADRQAFLGNTEDDIVVLDIPLLYETGSDLQMDIVVVVSATKEVQRDRVLARPGMTEKQFRIILDSQMSDTEKRSRADHVIPTLTLEDARKSVQDLLRQIRKKLNNA